MRNATRYSRVNGNTKYCTIRDSRAEGDTAEQVEIKLSNQTTPNSEPDCYTDNSTILNLKPTLTRDLVENGPKDRWKDPIRTIEIFRTKSQAPNRVSGFRFRIVHKAFVHDVVRTGGSFLN